MSQNWMRHFELQILDNNGAGISLSELKVTFEIERNDNRWPATALIKIYNLSKDTQSRIQGKEFSKIILIAGYDGIAPDVKATDVGVARNITPAEVGKTEGSNFGVIFSGQIRFTVTGKDNPTDSWLKIQACDGEEAFYEAFINATLSKGYTQRDVYNLLMERLKPYGISSGVIPVFPNTVYPRGATFYGYVRDYLTDLANLCEATWQFSYGKVDIIQNDVAKHQAVVLNSNTGLVGMPQQTIGAGVNVRCLINSNIQLHGLIHLDQSSVYRTPLSNQDIFSGQFTEKDVNGNIVTTSNVRDSSGKLVDSPATQQPASIATDGTYIVRYISYTGDTRGQAWYMDLVCEAAGSADLPSNSYLLKQD